MRYHGVTIYCATPKSPTWDVFLDDRGHVAACTTEEAALAAARLLTGRPCVGCDLGQNGKHRFSCSTYGVNQLKIPASIEDGEVKIDPRYADACKAYAQVPGMDGGETKICQLEPGHALPHDDDGWKWQ